MKGYIKAEDFAELWNITVRQVQYLCKHDKIEGAEKFGTTWAIPENAKKPTRTGKYKPGRKSKFDLADTSANLPHEELGKVVKGSLTLDLLANRAILNGVVLELYQKEFDVLFFLAQHDGKTLNSTELYEKIWARPMTGDKGALQTVISRLRKHIAGCEYGIVTIRNGGYVFKKL